jgi:hypothetical protein
MQALNSAVDVGRLYDELGECIQANDQDGVQRIFAELVRAKRPLAEIVGEVKRLSRGGARSEPEPSATDEWPQPGVAPQPVEPAPEPTPLPTYTNFARASMAPANPPSPESIAVYQEPERDAAALDEWRPIDATPEAIPSNAEAEFRSVDPSTAFDLPSHSDTAAIPAISNAEPERALPDEWARADALPERGESVPEPDQSAPDPIRQLFERAIELETASEGVAGTIVEDGDLAPQALESPQYAPAELDQGTPDTAPQISGRAIALGVGLDSSEGADTTQSKRARGPLAARLATVVAIIAVLGGGGAFLLMKPAGEPAADRAIPSAVATPAPAAKPAPSETQMAAAPASGRATERASGLAATALLPAPAAPSPQAATAMPDGPAAGKPADPAAVVSESPAVSKPGNPAAVLPDSSASAKPNVKPTVASLEPPGRVMPKTPAEAEMPAPAPAPAAAPPVEAPPPAQPRSSSLETAPLLERGDRLFGMGDVTSARLFYERAADAGDGQAALRLGETFDPHFLDRAKLRSVQGDPAAAVFWYRRARELGVAEAEILLKGIQTK